MSTFGMFARQNLVALADSARDAKQWESASRFYRKALDRNPNNPPIWVQYGHALKESGHLADAEAAYRRSLADEPNVADSHLQLGKVLKLQGQTDAARAAYLRAFAIDPFLIHSLTELEGCGWSHQELVALKAIGGSAEQSTAAPDISTRSADGNRGDLGERIQASGLFSPDVYLSLHEDLRADRVDPWAHFLRYGLREGRHFTNTSVVAKQLAAMDAQVRLSSRRFAEAAEHTFTTTDSGEIASLFGREHRRIGVFCNSEGNFFMREIADLFALGLRAEGVETEQRDETASKDEPFDIRIFVAPHEFFFLGGGMAWQPLAAAPNSVLYNVEQVQTPWFCRAFPMLLNAPLVLDLNFQSAEILRNAGCNVLHFMPGYLSTASYARPFVDASGIELLKGYEFARKPYDWTERDRLNDRPIDAVFVGSDAPRRGNALLSVQRALDKHRFLCVYSKQNAPLTARNYRTTSTEINCALGQRTKILLNIHRDWLGYFEWSRMVLQGMWQGACVVSDPSLPNPIFRAGEHYLEENVRHIGELLRWLLETQDGREKLDSVRRIGHRRATTIGSMPVALGPVLEAFGELLSVAKRQQVGN